MKQLFSILLMNAWRGLRRRGILPTAAMVTFGAMALIVASDVAAGASPDFSNALHRTSSHTSRLAGSALAMLGGKPTSPPGAHVPAKGIRQNRSGNKPVGPALSETTPTGSGSQTGTPVVLADLNLTPLVCQQNQQGQPAYTVQSASITFKNPTTAAGTVNWYWEVQTVSSGSTVDSQQVGSSQSVASGSSQVTLVANSSDSSQPLLSIPASSNNAAYSIRLHIAGLINATSSWISVPQTTSC